MTPLPYRNRLALTLLFWLSQALTYGCVRLMDAGEWMGLGAVWTAMALISGCVWRIGRMADIWDERGEG